MCLEKLYDGALYDFNVVTVQTNPTTGIYNALARNTRRRAILLTKVVAVTAAPSDTNNAFLGIVVGTNFVPIIMQPSGQPEQWVYYSDIGPLIFEQMFIKGDNVALTVGVIEILFNGVSGQ